MARRQLWDVVIEAHHVPPRYHVAEQHFRVPAERKVEAIRRAVRWAAADAAIPPWKPAMRVIAEHATAAPATDNTQLALGSPQ